MDLDGYVEIDFLSSFLVLLFFAHCYYVAYDIYLVM